MEALVSKPDHGETIIDKFNEELVASQRLQIFFDDIVDKINELGGPTTGTIEPSTFLQSSIIYKPSVGTDILPAVIEENEVLGRLPGGEIMGLGFVDNWSILGNGTTNITINNTGGANSFTIESNTSSTMFRVDGANNRVGISLSGLPATDGTLHIINSAALGGPVTADADGDDLVLEHDLFGGMSILNGSNSTGNIFFGSPAYGERAGHIFFLHDTDFNLPRMEFDVRDNTFLTLYDTLGSFFNEFQDTDIDFQINTVGSAPFMRIESSDNRMGLSQGVSFAPTDGVLHIFKGGSAGAVTAATTADALVLESNTSTGLTIQTGATTQAIIALNTQDAKVWNVGWDSIIKFGDNAAISSFAGTDGFSFNTNMYEPATGWEYINTGFALEVVVQPTFFRVIALPSMSAGTAINFGTANFLSYESTFTQFNIHENDVDFQVKGLSNAALLFADAANNRIGFSTVGVFPTDGTIHIINADAGAITADAGANELVIEGTGARGMSFLVDNATGVANIAFGDPSNGATAGLIQFTAATASYAFFVTAREALTLLPTELVFNEGGLTNMDTRFESLNSNRILFIDASADRIGIADNGFAPSDGLIHVFQGGSAGVVAAHANADTIVLESNTHLGITLLAPADGTTSNIYFGNTTQNNDGIISFEGFNQRFIFSTNAVEGFRLDAVEAVFNDTGIDTDLRAESNGNTAKLFLDAGIDELQTAAGTAPTAVANIGGNLSIDNGTAGTTAVVTEETLLTYTLPANSLTQNGRGVRVRAWGTTAANANLKTVRLKFGATNVLDTGAVASNGETWYFEADVYRTGAATQDAIGKPYFYVAGINNGQITNPAETLSAGFAIVVSGQNGTATVNDIVAEGLSVEYICLIPWVH